MPREFHRSQRVAEAIHRTLSELLRTEAKDARLSAVTLTHVAVSRDLAVAKIYYTLRQGEDEGVAGALKHAAGFLRRELARDLRLRLTPELRFIRDESIERGEALTALIDEARRQDRERAVDGPEDAADGAADGAAETK